MRKNADRARPQTLAPGKQDQPSAPVFKARPLLKTFPLSKVYQLLEPGPVVLLTALNQLRLINIKAVLH